MQVRIGQKIVGTDRPVLIIAEAGVNHNGSLTMAKRLIKAAQEAGADVIKFQTFSTEEVVSRNTPLVGYQKAGRRGSQTQYELLKSLELDGKAYAALSDYARSLGILFLSTPDDQPSVNLLNDLRVPAFKIGSSDLTNIPFLKYVASFRKPIILSTGMSTLSEVREAVQAIKKTSSVPLILMHTTTRYPCPLEDVNMRSLRTLKNEFSLPVGYSDHTPGVSAAMAAVSLGACIIEKHFTLDRDLPGPDHKASYEPGEFKVFIQLIREIETCLGSAQKKPTLTEKKDIPLIRKSLMARVDIPKGTILKKEHVAVKRPQTGALPGEMERVLGKRTKRGIAKDCPIRKSDIA